METPRVPAMTPNWIDSLISARVYDLEQPRFAGMPIHASHKPGYFYALHRRHRDTYHPDSLGPRSSASGTLNLMEHSGTHLDALCHQANELRMFGGINVESAETPAGFSQLGVETVPPLLRRGLLLDICAHKGEQMLRAKYGITADDLAKCADAQNVQIRSGDVLLVRTGYGALWQGDEQTYLDAAGVSKSGTLWAADHGVSAVGADNIGWDLLDERDPDTGATLFAHIHLLTQKGIYIIENLNLEELSRDQQWEFAFIGIPLKFQGATGSPLRPLALV
jgi:kynurenine formamidase